MNVQQFPVQCVRVRARVLCSSSFSFSDAQPLVQSLPAALAIHDGHLALIVDASLAGL